jgi:hypothetical protein
VNLLIDDLTDVLHGISQNDAGSRATWARMKLNPNYRILHDLHDNSLLCLALSQLPDNVLDSGPVQLLLDGLPLYREPFRQISCITSPVTVPPTKFEKYSTFINQLSVITDPRLWRYIVESYAELKGPLERTTLLEKCPRLVKSTEREDMVGQLCAIKSVPKSDYFAKMLPVFTTTEGAQIIEEDSTSNLCERLFNRPDSTILSKLITDSNALFSNEAKVSSLGTDFDINSNLSGSMPVETFQRLLRDLVIIGDIGRLFRLVDYSDQLLRIVPVDDALTMGAMLSSQSIPPELFILFLKRAGNVVTQDQRYYRPFMYEVVRKAESYHQHLFYKWYLELTLFEPSIAGIAKIALPLWDWLLTSNDSISQHALATSTRGTDEKYLLELVLAKSRCMTSQPLLEPSRCGELSGLVQELRLSFSECLSGGYWRLASLSMTSKAQLIEYLEKSRPSISVMAWILSQLGHDKVVETKLLDQLRVLIDDSTVRTFLAFFETTLQAGSRTICRALSDAPLPVASELFISFLDKHNGRRYVLKAWERFQIIRALVSAMTGVHPDSFDYVATGDESASDIFNILVQSYCQRWSDDLGPGLKVIDQ